jgi:2-dehydropantoate 2-reductase
VTDIAVIGPGAIGCAFAGALAEAGHEIAVAGRTRVDRIVVTHPAGTVEAPVRWLGEGTPDRPQRSDSLRYDIVVLATKAHQTAAAAPWIARLCRPGTRLAVLQNGVEHRARVGPLVADDVTIVPAIVACPSDRTAPGRVTVRGVARLDLDATPGAADVVAAFAGSFAEVRISDDWLSAAWRKLALNAAGGGIGVLTRRGNEVLRDPGVRAVFVAIVAEVVTVARAEGADLPDDLGDRIVDGLAQSVADHLPSIVVDRLAGRPTEWEARNEVVVRAAKRHGIAVPYNEMVTALIRAGESAR